MSTAVRRQTSDVRRTTTLVLSAASFTNFNCIASGSEDMPSPSSHPTSNENSTGIQGMRLTDLSAFSIGRDGWVVTPDGKLLFWVSPDNQLGLFRSRTLKVLGTVETRIDLRDFVHGTAWMGCRHDL